ncbi:MAG: hypothetical protein M0R49_03680 [Limnochordia bacterium]|nr:hypothetical protein [Limnochordia bacterium]MDD5605665.1 hypothetical protein [Dehalococcoidales bacterium]
MIITVTVSTITTITALGGTGIAGVLGAVAVIMLIVFLSIKELAGAGTSEVSERISSFVTMPIVPLLFAFAVIVAVKVVEIIA